LNKEYVVMWMTREEISAMLGIVPNSVRGKVQKGQIERKVEGGKNFYRLADSVDESSQPIVGPSQAPQLNAHVQEAKKIQTERPRAFNPKEVLLGQLASIKVDRNIAAIEKGDEIDLATGEISRELDAKISMRQHRQLKEIEDALERLKLGDYGSCEDCGEPIPEQRLRLFPAARLCVRCQEEMDHYEKMKDHQGLRGGPWREESGEGGFIKSFED
jgi:DnaK suppressor protein